VIRYYIVNSNAVARLPGCGANCLSCTAVGTTVTCIAGQCAARYALNSNSPDKNTACVGEQLSLIMAGDRISHFVH